MEESDSETGNVSDSSSEDARKKRHRHGRKSKATSQVSAENHTAVAALKDATSTQEKIATPRSLAQEDKSQLENGEMRTNGVSNSRSERNPDIVPVITGNRSKSRSQSMSANHSMSKSMSVSPRSPIKRSYVSPKRVVSPSPVHQRHSRSPVLAPKQKKAEAHPDGGISA